MSSSSSGFLFNFAKPVKLSVIFNSTTKTAELTQPRPIRLFGHLAFFPLVDCVIDVILYAYTQNRLAIL